jgi:transposase-like protein
MDALEWLRKHLEADGSDVLREMIKTFAETLIAAAADAAYGEANPGRVTKRNGYRSRDFDSGPGRSSWRSPSCVDAATSPTACCRRDALRRRR